MKMIYLDNAATTRPCEAAVKAMEMSLREEWGNPSSAHAFGGAAARSLDKARRTVSASLGLGAKDGRVIFTGSGTEGNNTAIFGTVYAKNRPETSSGRGKIITTDSEHPSVEEAMRRLEGDGFSVVRISTKGGRLDLDQLRAQADRSVILASIMLANNETGALYDVKSAGDIIRSASPKALIHSDMVQAYTKTLTSPKKLGVDLLTVSAHKIFAPKGVGALWVREELFTQKSLIPYLVGGGQERTMRSGTENLPAIAAFAAAAEEMDASKDSRREVVAGLYAYLTEETARRLPEVRMNLPESSVGCVVSMTLPGIKSETMLNFLSAREIYVSAGSACSAHAGKPSSVLQAFGLSEREADTTLRVSFSHYNTVEELSIFCDALAEGIATLARMR